MEKLHDNSPIITSWRVVDSHWRCINRPEVSDSISDYLWRYGFVIPSTVVHCVASNQRYKVDFRRTGGNITLIIHQKF